MLCRAVQGPFSAVVDKHVTDPWLKAMLDLECFVLSGMLAKDTLTAGEAQETVPQVCGQALADALVLAVPLDSLAKANRACRLQPGSVGSRVGTCNIVTLL